MKEDIGYAPAVHRRDESPPLPLPAEIALILAVALVLLIPCFWQPHIQAGDLANHVYNAWLVQQIKAGAATGMKVVWQPSNVLTDWALEFLLPRVGWVAAERIVVGVCIEVFFWGAFAFICRVSGKRPWLFAPSLGMMAYGLVFHFGFLNFYLSTGLSLWLMCLLWERTWRKIAMAAPLFVLAFLAHFVPLAWAVGALVYVTIERRVKDDFKPLVLFGALGMLVAIMLGLTATFPNQWDLGQIISVEGLTGFLGVEQFWLYGAKYLIVAGGMALLYLRLFSDRVQREGFWKDPLAHLWILMLATFAIMPNGIQLAKGQFSFLFIPQRLSLFVGLLFCAMVSRARHGSGLTRISSLLAGVFFTMLYLDARAFSGVENQVARLLAQVPARQRVVVAMRDSGSPLLNGVVHIGSASCIGHCFIYNNYEPATGGQFRIRATEPNPYNTTSMKAAQEMEEGRHVITPQEAPIYSVCPTSATDATLVLRKLGAGEKTCYISFAATPQLTN